jgi:hypothetical protein
MKLIKNSCQASAAAAAAAYFGVYCYFAIINFWRTNAEREKARLRPLRQPKSVCVRLRKKTLNKALCFPLFSNIC